MLYSGWHNHKVFVMVHERGTANIGTTLRSDDHADYSSSSVRFRTPNELRGFALKCFAAAEVMEKESA